MKIGADNGSAYGQYMLGFLYRAGEIGLLGRDKKAVQYFEMAAKQGHAKSQIELANMIMTGNHNGYTLDDVVFGYLVLIYMLIMLLKKVLMH